MKYLDFSLLLIPLGLAFFSQSAGAVLVTIDFDSLNTSAGAVTGEPVASYLKSYGVTVSNSSSGSVLHVNQGEGWLSVPSAPNAFTLIGPTAGGNTFTLNFSSLISDFSFTRVGFFGAGSPKGNILGPWSASAYDAGHKLLGTVGESLYFAYGDIPAHTFALDYNGISSITFYGNALGMPGVQMPYIDNISYTTVAIPEPEVAACCWPG